MNKIILMMIIVSISYGANGLDAGISVIEELTTELTKYAFALAGLALVGFVVMWVMGKSQEAIEKMKMTFIGLLMLGLVGVIVQMIQAVIT